MLQKAIVELNRHRCGILVFKHLYWLVFLFIPTLTAQQESPNALPDSSVILWKVKPSEVIQSQVGELLPWEVLGAISREQLGIDILRLPTICGALESTASGVDYSVCFTRDRSADIASLNAQYFGPLRTSEVDDNVRLRSWKRSDIRVIQTGYRWIAGTDSHLKKILDQNRESHRLSNRLGDLDEALVLILDMQKLQANLPNYLRDLNIALDSEIAGIMGRLAAHVDYAEIRLVLRNQLSLEVSWVCKDSATTQEVARWIDTVIKSGGDVIFDMAKNLYPWPSLDGISPDIWLAYWRRLSVDLSDAVTIEMNDKVIVTRLNHLEELISLVSLAAMSPLPLEKIQADLPRPTTEANLETLAIALHSFEAVHRRIPTRAIRDKSDKPLLSWRVLLLPYIGEEELYSQFRLDEAWDSDHNKKLLAKMPAVFRNPNAELPLGFTSYLAPYGYTERREQTVWDIEPLLLRQVSDGLANTAVILEVVPESAVPWTKPEDFDLRERELQEFLGEPPTGGLMVMLDTTCYDLSGWKDKRRLKGVLTVQGGEPVTAPF